MPSPVKVLAFICNQFLAENQGSGQFESALKGHGFSRAAISPIIGALAAEGSFIQIESLHVQLLFAPGASI
jgi:hypothetical protein